MKNFINGFTKLEKIWVSVFTAAILGSTMWFSWLYTDWTSWQNVGLNWIVSPISAITGILCVVLAAKGKISTFTWGVVNCVTYGTLSFLFGIYGDAIINLLYFLPLQFIGLIIWKKNMSGEVVKSSVLRHPLITTIIAILTWFGFGKLLSGTDGFLNQVFNQNSTFYDAMPKGIGSLIDASTEVFQFFGQFLMTIAKWESWIFWILTNVVSIFMWSVIIIADPSTSAAAVPTLIMFIAYLVNSVYGAIEWKKRSKMLTK